MRFIATLLVFVVAVSAVVLPLQPKHNLALPEDQIQAQKVESRHPVLVVRSRRLKYFHVVFKDFACLDTIKKIEDDVANKGGLIGQVYNTVMQGFGAWIPIQIVVALSNNPFIDHIKEHKEEPPFWANVPIL
ncbi:hypothetical protein BGX27_004669 [Mortierella sp. AM989]|nr:hypothetical protein BGX27_004669 [Mortierella sp. AM989]